MGDTVNNINHVETTLGTIKVLRSVKHYRLIRKFISDSPANRKEELHQEASVDNTEAKELDRDGGTHKNNGYNRRWPVCTQHKSQNMALQKGSTANDLGDGPKQKGMKRGASDVDKLRSVLQFEGTPNILETHGFKFTGINHCGGVTPRRRSDRGYDSVLIPILEEMTKGKIVCHIGVECNLNTPVHHDRPTAMRKYVQEVSQGKVDGIFHGPNKEATSSSAISGRNDSMILTRSDIELSNINSSAEPLLSANGRVSMVYKELNKAPIAIIAVYGPVKNCGVRKTRTNSPKKEADALRKQQLKDYHDCCKHVCLETHRAIREAEQKGVGIVLFTDANRVDNIMDRSTGRQTTSTGGYSREDPAGNRFNILDTINGLDMHDVWKETQATPGYTYDHVVDGKVTSSHRIDRFYVNERTISLAGGIDKVKIGVATQSAGLSDKHKLLTLHLPEDWGRLTKERTSVFDPSRGPKNKRFLLQTDDEKTLFAKLLDKDTVLLRCLEETKAKCGIQTTNGRINYFSIATAMRHLHMLQEEVTPAMTRASITTALQRQLKLHTGRRPDNTTLTEAASTLYSVTEQHSNNWGLGKAQTTSHEAMNTLHKTVVERARTHEQFIVTSRKKRKHSGKKAKPTDMMAQFKELTGIVTMWETSTPKTIWKAAENTMHKKKALPVGCRIPIKARDWTESEWLRWKDGETQTGLPMIHQKLVELECSIAAMSEPADNPRTSDAAVAGSMFSKERGSIMQGLTIIDVNTGLTEWVSSTESLTELLEATIQHTSRRKIAPAAGQNLICTIWIDLLTNTQTMWNGTTIHELKYNEDDSRQTNYDRIEASWREKRTNIIKLSEDISSWLKTRDDTETNGIKMRCVQIGSKLQDNDDVRDWLSSNLTEFKVTISFIDTHLPFLFHCICNKPKVDDRTKEKWRKLDKAPSTIDEIVATAASMRKNKSHCTLSPEHVITGGTTLQRCYLELVQPYFAGDVPQSMKTGIITALYKDNKRFRPVTSCPLAWQLGEQTHAKLEGELVIDMANGRQFGGVKGKSASEPLLELQLLLADAAARDANLTIIYSDKTSAFDSLNVCLFPILYGRWHCPNHISSRMTATASGHRRVVRANAGAKALDLAFNIDGGVPGY